jgi:hypothetical protein
LQKQWNSKNLAAQRLLVCEGIASGDRPAIQPLLEPTHPLLRTSMREGFWLDAAARHLLDVIISDGRRCSQRGLHITRVQ